MGGEQRPRLARTLAQEPGPAAPDADAVLMGDLEEKAKRADSCAETSEAKNPGMA